MKSYQYDSAGNLVASANTDGGGSSAAKSYSPQWSFWTDGTTNQAFMPTTYQNITAPIIRWNGNAYGTMGAGQTMKSPGYITALVALVNGNTQVGGVTKNVYFQVYKNGNPLGIIASGGSASAAMPLSANGGSQYTFVAGDVLSVWVKGDDAAINQSMNANLEWVLTG